VSLDLRVDQRPERPKASGGVPVDEVVFLVEESPEGGHTARALGECIFTEADDLTSLRENVIDAVRCHYGDSPDRPRVIRLHFVRDEVLKA
jgi:alkanesulfonate monooxygenase SsuD/methylene tetrahydromethanopterin reductase-like flavin-dependent oxidoreductase (luciferase family)